jgi:glutamine amidotransferase-like uncharacterized protein
MNLKNSLILLMLFLFSFYSRAEKPIALVYNGYGACTEDCALGAAQVAELAGFEVRYVNPENYSRDLLDDAALWVQPGGKSTNAAKAMGAEMLNDIKVFIATGGGYVGFCAGAFLSTHEIGTSGKKGLGIVDGNTILYKGASRSYTSEPSTWVLSNGEVISRNVYWEGGPRFYFNKKQKQKVVVTNHYAKTNQVAGVKTSFGNGRVSVTGMHPEAPAWWFEGIPGTHATSWDLGVDMMKWATTK